MQIGPDGWLKGAEIRKSPFFNGRPEGEKIRLIVVHNISLPAGQFGSGYVDDLFLGCLDCQREPSFADLKGLQVSSHFFINRKGKIFQYVSCNDRAWHAGVSCFCGTENCNNFSIGIELEGSDFTNFENKQYESLSKLVKAISKAYPIEAITGHSDIAPGRKTDPGPFFDWTKLASLSGLADSLSFPNKA